jgi:hypothetical protein
MTQPAVRDPGRDCMRDARWCRAAGRRDCSAALVVRSGIRSATETRRTRCARARRRSLPRLGRRHERIAAEYAVRGSVSHAGAGQSRNATTAPTTRPLCKPRSRSRPTTHGGRPPTSVRRQAEACVICGAVHGCWKPRPAGLPCSQHRSPTSARTRAATDLAQQTRGWTASRTSARCARR